MEKDNRSIYLDFLKGIAIVAVVLYHFGGGLLPYGYLGVDIFFVIGGYLTIGSLKRQIEGGKFNFWRFLFRKIIRLYPLVIFVSIISMGIGYFLMLPDDFENLAESAIASSVFANNVIQCITTKNYWDVINLYKPLMHLWYVGLLMQIYVILPIVFLVLAKLMKNITKGIAIGTVGLTMISLMLFLIPTFPSAWKFYYLPFRIFEVTAGGLLIFWKPKIKDTRKFIPELGSLILLIFLLCSRVEIISGNIMLLLTVFVTLVFISCTEGRIINGLTKEIMLASASVGKRSYSIYIWHQMIIAFLFYSFYTKHNCLSFLVLAVLTILISLLSYRFIELPFGKTIGNKKKEATIILSTFILAIILCGASFLAYRNAGVVRDVPELNIYKDNIHRGMHSEYCDRPYTWDMDFEDDNRIKIMVIGNSFGRDWANILREWDASNRLQISYLYYTEDSLLHNTERIDSADFVFYADGPGYNGVPEIVRTMIDERKLYIVGNKNYGESNGIIYAQRHSANYFTQNVEISAELLTENNKALEAYNNHYIDMMSCVMVDNTHVRVFTDDNMFISQDCRHLTQAGALYYAKVLNTQLNELFAVTQ